MSTPRLFHYALIHNVALPNFNNQKKKIPNFQTSKTLQSITSPSHLHANHTSIHPLLLLPQQSQKLISNLKLKNHRARRSYPRDSAKKKRTVRAGGIKSREAGAGTRKAASAAAPRGRYQVSREVSASTTLSLTRGWQLSVGRGSRAAPAAEEAEEWASESMWRVWSGLRVIYESRSCFLLFASCLLRREWVSELWKSCVREVGFFPERCWTLLVWFFQVEGYCGDAWFLDSGRHVFILRFVCG